MTSSDKAPEKGFFSAVAGDAFLFTAALFALDIVLVGAIMSLGGLISPNGPVGVLGMVVSGTGSLLGVVAVIAGPIIAWRLHGRDFGNTAIAGIAIGIVAGAVLMGGGFLVLAGVAQGIGALTGNEFVGLGVLVATLVVAFLVVVVRMDVDAVRDLSPERSTHRRIDTLRLSATAVLVVYAIGVAVLVVLNPGSEIGEAILFAILAGANAGLVTAFADMWVRRAERKHTDAGAPAGAR